MPIYEYRCRACDHPFELLVRGSTVPACPKCQSTDIERLLSVFAVGGKTGSSAPPAPERCASCPDRGGSCGFPEFD